MSNPQVSLSTDGIEVRLHVGAGPVFASTHEPTQAYLALVNGAPFETGFLPPHVISIRTMGDHEQYVLCLPPSANTVIWVDAERAPERSYLLAQPYRVIIGDFVDGQFLGARLFYSPHQVTHFDAPLYHANVPNLNCRGYSGTSVGWLCLYPNEDTTVFSVAQRIAYLGLKTSGNEAFNDENMSETDGPRFYADYDAPSYVWDPEQWERKTIAEGVDWITNPDLWLPVLVTNADDQDEHDPEGVPLTLAMAMTGHYKAYYPGRHLKADRLTPLNLFARTRTIDLAQIVTERAAAVRTTPALTTTTIAPVAEASAPVDFLHPTPTAADITAATTHAHAALEASAAALSSSVSCTACSVAVHEDDIYPSPYDDQVYCETCWYQYFSYCSSCENPFSTEDLTYYEHLDECWCDSCYSDHYYRECDDCEEYCLADDQGEYSFQRYDLNGQPLGFWCAGCYNEHIGDANILGTCAHCGATQVPVHDTKCALCIAQANTSYPVCTTCGATDRPVCTIDPIQTVGCVRCTSYTRCARCACHFHESVFMHKVPGLETDIGFCPHCIANVYVCHAPDCGAFGSQMGQAEDSDLTYCNDHLGTCAKCQRQLARPFDGRGWCSYCVNWEAQLTPTTSASPIDAVNQSSVNSYYAEEAGGL